jgi:UPF0755 protein
MMRRLLWSSGVLLLLIALLLAATWRHYTVFRDTPVPLTDSKRFEVVQGDSVAAVIRRLPLAGDAGFDWRWRLLLRLHPVTIQAGEYDIPVGLRPQQLLDLLASGKVVQYRFTVVEGWTYGQLRAALLARPELEGNPEDLDAATVMARLGSEEVHPEGWFLPETYAFVRHTPPLEILGRAHHAMQAALAVTWESRADDLPLDSPYQMLILASIVERETGVAQERAEVAGVFTRRLQQGWRLETDPSVIYGLGDGFDGDIRRRDLKADTPYNTYIRYGLPPTPIAMPGLPTLQAVASPVGGTAMFFVSDGQGGHVFSDTLEQHNRAVQALISGKAGS